MLGDIGLSTWHTAKSASPRIGATLVNIGKKSQPSAVRAASATDSWMSRSPVAAIVKEDGPSSTAAVTFGPSATTGGLPDGVIAVSTGAGSDCAAVSEPSVSSAIDATAPATSRMKSAHATPRSNGDSGHRA